MKGMRIFALSALAVLAAASQAVRINEMARDVPGADGGFEFVELKGAPGESLDGLWLLVIEGDNSSQGLIDQAIPLQGLTLGSNGLLLIRDAAAPLLPLPDPATTVLVNDFTPDIENGSATYAIVRDYTGYVINQNTNTGQNNVLGQTDIDSNNDGTMGDWGTITGTNPLTTTPGGSQPWTDVVDSMGWLEGDNALDLEYGSQMMVGGLSFGTTVGRGTSPITFISDGYLVLLNDIRTASDIDTNQGTVPSGGPYPLDPDEAEGFGANLVYDEMIGATYTPGSENVAITEIVAPSAINIVSGTPFGGDIPELLASDDAEVFILNDESMPNCVVEISGQATGIITSSIKLTVEFSSTRTDQVAFFDLFNATTNAFVNQGNMQTSTADQVFETTVTTGATNFIDGARMLKSRFRVFPQEDLIAEDGWSSQLDMVEFRIK